MNGIQTSRSVYYSLLIVCMAAALLTVFLPFAILNNCYFYIEEQLQGLGSIPLSALSYLHPGRIGRYFRGDYTNYTFVLLLNLVLGAFAVLLQLLSIRRVLEALKWEEHRSQELSLGGGPIAGLLLCGMQIASPSFSGHIRSASSFRTQAWFRPSGLFWESCSISAPCVLQRSSTGTVLPKTTARRIDFFLP